MAKKVVEVFTFHEHDDDENGGNSAQNNDGQENVFDDSILLSPDCEDDIDLIDSDNIEEILREEISSPRDPILADPTQHYIKEMVNMALLTREEEKEIAMRIEKSKEEIKRIIISFPGTFSELLHALESLKTSKSRVTDISDEVDEDEVEDSLKFRRSGY